MSNLTIRNLDPEVKHSLRRLAAERGVSMEQEARERLAESVNRATRRKTSIFDELTKLGAAPDEPFDQKRTTDEMWDESFR
ncbi:FitA-like ribbon-helix-helix domain-containing protein [Aquibium oceanicum]|uniref:Antitoxin FitA-like ribbon-helix-helix domain-containing protein n=1 Tax=Aquibium oceanicum TaxID=1670800 RepID=A0A1L3SM18_9HYPH|nr:hypothetical protein [Aquibium oceanicum]APH70443.1 hypothetical protein BSQ44_02885 [Aquibium oceanicum]